MAPIKPRKRRHGTNKKFKGVRKQEKRQQMSDAGSTTDTNATATTESDTPTEDETTAQGAFTKKMARLQTSTGNMKPPSKKDLKKKSLPARAEQPKGYRLVDMDQLSQALSELHICDGGKLLLREDPADLDGLCTTLYFCCSKCGNGMPMKTSQRFTSQGKSYDVNRRMSYACVSTGIGQEGLNSVCGIMNMPPPVESPSYKCHLDRIHDKVKTVTEKHKKDAADRLREHLITELDDDDVPLIHLKDPNAAMDVAVTYDGTWMKRGFTANYGVGVVMSIDTGEVLDTFVCSKICEICKKHESDDNSDSYKEWKTEHLTSGKCQKNYEGSSPGMEAYAAKQLWERSVGKLGLRYRWMICDGDSKSHAAVKDVYDTDHPVVKLDCIGHVGKRMYKGLETVRKNTKGKLSDGKFVGGGKGRLTSGPKGVVTRLSELYRNAIRQNNNPSALGDEDIMNEAVRKMQRAIMAILHHMTKLNDRDRHKYCPDGDDSWCAFRRDGEMTDKDYHLDPVFFDLLKPVFERLSAEELLERCLPGYTQNQNESFNNVIWTLCPKNRWRGPVVVNTAVCLAVLRWDCGDELSHQLIMSELNLVTGKYTKAASSKRDSSRKYNCNRAATDKAKTLRIFRNKKHAAMEKAAKEREGKTYGFAAFAGLDNDESDSD